MKGYIESQYGFGKTTEEEIPDWAATKRPAVLSWAVKVFNLRIIDGVVHLVGTVHGLETTAKIGKDQVVVRIPGNNHESYVFTPQEVEAELRSEK